MNPRKLYYIEKSGEKFTRQATGEWVVSRFLQGLPDWRRAEGGDVMQKKILLLADFTASAWSKSRAELIRAHLLELIYSRFTVYLWQGNRYVELTESNVHIILKEEVRRAITEVPEEKLVEHALAQLKTSYDKIHFIDTYWLSGRFLEKLRESAAWILEDVTCGNLILKSIKDPSQQKYVQYSVGYTVQLLKDKYFAAAKKKLNVITLCLEFDVGPDSNPRDLVGVNPDLFQNLIKYKIADDNPHIEFFVLIEQMSDLSELECVWPRKVVKVPQQIFLLSILYLGIKHENQYPEIIKLMQECKKLNTLGLRFMFEGGIRGDRVSQLIDNIAGDIRQLSVTGMHLSAEHFMQINNKFNNIFSLSIQAKDINFESFNQTQVKLEKITYLTLDGTYVQKNKVNSFFSAFTNLESIHFKSSAINTILVDSTIKNENVRTITVTANRQLSIAKLKALKRSFPRLANLYIGNEQRVRLSGKNFTRDISQFAADHGIDIIITDLEYKELFPLAAQLEKDQYATGLPRFNFASKAFDRKPPDENYEFKFERKEDSKSQEMITDKLCQFLTIKNIYLEMIPKIKKGICEHLASIFAEMDVAKWSAMLRVISDWDGKSETLNQSCHTALELIFNRFLDGMQNLVTSQQVYCGDHFDKLLTLPMSPIRLMNPWHMITVKAMNDHEWMVYDPNFKNGYIVVKEHQLRGVVIELIGSQIACDKTLPQDYPLAIKDKNAFIREGGLLFLHGNNLAKLKHLLPLPAEIDKASIQGLHLRDIQCFPAWCANFLNTCDELQLYTLQLLRHMLQCYGSDLFNREIKKSLSEVPSFERHIVLEAIMKKAAAISDENERLMFVTEISKAVHDSTIEQECAKALSTWQPDQKRLESADHYLHRVILSFKLKRLIEFIDSDNLQAMILALHSYSRKINRPIFYINSPEDMITSAPYVVRHGNRGVIQRPPGGPLHHFLTEHQYSGKLPLIVINYENFMPQDIVRLNTILDANRRVDMINLPSSALVIGLINTQHDNYYKGNEFYSRFDGVDKSHLTRESLKQYIKPVPMLDADVAMQTSAINLFKAMDWEDRLMGRWIVQGDILVYKEGKLSKALKKGLPLKIINGLWDDDEFNKFWELAMARGYFANGHEKIPVPEHFCIVKSEGYHPALQNFTRDIYQGFRASALTLNPSLYKQFFIKYHIDNERRQLFTIAGFIKANASKCLDVNVTRPLAEAQWAELRTKCKKYNVKLNCHYPVDTKKLAWTVSNHSHTQIIETTDAGLTIAIITAKDELWIEIDISECEAGDLLMQAQGSLTVDLKLEFCEKQRALLNALQQGKNVILKGNFKNHLIDQLYPLLISRQASQTCTGKLILVTEQENIFPGLTVNCHVNTRAEMHEAISQKLPHHKVEDFLNTFPDRNYYELCATLASQKARPDAVNKNPWQGMYEALPFKLAQDFDAVNYQRIADYFNQQRLTLAKSLMSHSPITYFTGLSGVGKTIFVEENLGTVPGTRTLYQGGKNIKHWAMDKSTGLKILFIDESNLGGRQWSEFEGLFAKHPTILIDGEVYELTIDHKLVFASNPLSYGGGRVMAHLFDQHGNAIYFEPMPNEYIYAKLLKPIFTGTTLEEMAPQLARDIFQIYHFVMQFSTTEVLISPRELQMMALLTTSHFLHHHSKDVAAVCRHYAYQIARPLVPAERLSDYDQRFLATQLSFKHSSITTSNYLVTSSRQSVAMYLQDLFTLRMQRRGPNNMNDAQKYGGLGGIILEGEAGVGKSELVIEMLKQSSVKEFYHIPVSMQKDEKISLLINAFHEGAVVVMDEINSSPMMEELLNHLLMGRMPSGERPQRPGFMVIGTQNPVTNAGRQELTSALTARLTTMMVPPYNTAEMIDILVHRGQYRHTAILMVKIFEEMRAKAKAERLTPAPTFRDLLRLSDKQIKHSLPVHEKNNMNEVKITQVQNPTPKRDRETLRFFQSSTVNLPIKPGIYKKRK